MPCQWQLASLHPGMVQVDARRDDSLQAIHWVYRDRDSCILHSFELGSNPDLGIKDVQSAYGYGGPISNSEDPEFLRGADQAFCRWAQANSVVAEFLRFHPLVPHSRWYTGQVVRNRQTVYIDLKRGLFEQYEARRRSDLRRFIAGGLQIRRASAQVMREVFPAMYQANMDRVEASRSYYFPASYFEALFEFEGVENWLAWRDEQPIAGAVILVSPQASTVEYHLGAQAPDSAHYKVMVGLLHVIAEHYQNSSCNCFYLGGGRSVAADDSLLFFKKGFSPATSDFHTASKIYDGECYTRLMNMLPEKAATGRVLFYKD